MTCPPVNSADAYLATLNEGLPTVQALAEAAILEHLIGVFLANIAKAALPGDGGRLKKQEKR